MAIKWLKSISAAQFKQFWALNHISKCLILLQRWIDDENGWTFLKLANIMQWSMAIRLALTDLKIGNKLVMAYK